MNDPTNPALAVCFLMALAIGIAAVLVRQLGRRAQTATPPQIPAGKVQTWFYQPLDLIGPVIIFCVFLGLFTLTAFSDGQDMEDFNAFVLLFNIGFQFIIAAGMAAIALMRTSADNWMGLRWSGWYWVFLIAPACVGFMWLLFIGFEAMGYSKWMESLGVETVQDTVQIFQKSNDPLVIILMTLTAVVVAPLCEEIVFRGLFYPVMKRFSGILPAAICSSLVFAAAHGNLAVVLPLFILSILLVWIYELTGSLWAPIAIHCGFNAASVTAQLLMRYTDLAPASLLP